MSPLLIQVGLYLGFLGAGALIRHVWGQPAPKTAAPVAPATPTQPPAHPLLAAALKAIADYEQQHQAELAQKLLAIPQQAPAPAKPAG